MMLGKENKSGKKMILKGVIRKCAPSDSDYPNSIFPAMVAQDNHPTDPKQMGTFTFHKAN